MTLSSGFCFPSEKESICPQTYFLFEWTLKGEDLCAGKKQQQQQQQQKKQKKKTKKQKKKNNNNKKKNNNRKQTEDTEVVSLVITRQINQVYPVTF